MCLCAWYGSAVAHGQHRHGYVDGGSVEKQFSFQGIRWYIIKAKKTRQQGYCWWTNSRMTFIRALDMRCNPRSPSFNIESCYRFKMSMKQLMIESWFNKFCRPRISIDRILTKRCRQKMSMKNMMIESWLSLRFAIPGPLLFNIETCGGFGSP